MAEEATDDEEVVVGKPESSGNKMIIIILASVITLLVVAIIILFFTPLGKRILGTDDKAHAKQEEKEHIEEKVDPSKIAFINMPEILLSLRSKDGKGGFLKASFVVQVASEEIKQKIEKLKPVILDQMQTYLRELDLEDMRGSAGLQRIRQDLTARVNNVIAPEKIMAVLIKDFILQ